MIKLKNKKIRKKNEKELISQYKKLYITKYKNPITPLTLYPSGENSAPHPAGSTVSFLLCPLPAAAASNAAINAADPPVLPGGAK